MRTDPTHRASGAPRLVRHLLGTAVLLLAGAATAGAQSAEPGQTAVDPRFRAWLGCWSPLGDEGVVPTAAPLTCVVPAADRASAVDLITVADGKVVVRERLDGSGERRTTSQEGCGGWEQAQWSADGRRLHVRSSATCAAGVTRSSSSIFAFSPNGDWLEVRGAYVGAGSGLRTIRYRATTPSATLPVEVASARAVPHAEDIRLALGAPISTNEVADAVRLSDAGVVEGWLAALGQGFRLDAKELKALADRGVPGSVTDVMVALTYPRVFALTGGDSASRAGTGEQQVAQGRGPVAWLYDPLGYGAFGLSAYRSGAYGYNGYYNPYYGGYYPGRTPVVVVVRDEQASAERARAVNGRGYTRGGSGTSSPGATPRASAGSDGYRGGSSSSGSSSSGGSTSSGSSSSGSSSSGSSSEGGRTAKPRP